MCVLCVYFLYQSNKFDDQCTEFALHEELDGSGAVLTATLDNVSGFMSNITLSTSGTAGIIPLTVPTTGLVRKTTLREKVKRERGKQFGGQADRHNETAN